MKLRELADILSGKVLGDPDVEITGVSGIEEAKAGDITFLSSPKYLKSLRATSASCVIVKEAAENLPMPQLLVDNPQFAFAKVLELFRPAELPEPGTSHLASVSPTASVHATAAILPFAVVSDGACIGPGTVLYPGVFVGKRSVIGEHCTVHPNVTIREDVKVGNRVIIHAGSVIGADGFGYVLEKGEHYKIPQVGSVVIEDDVEIGANVTIDRATIDSTVVGRGTKIDNLVQIAHNVKIGEKSIIVAQVAIGGSTEIGSFVVIGGQSAVSDHSFVEPGTMIAGKSGVAGHVTKGVYAGAPAIPHKTWLRAQALYGKLPEMNKKIRELENRLTSIEKGIHNDDRQ